MHPGRQPFYAPLQDATFAILWCTALISLVASWMHEVGSAWFMREMTNEDPFMVSLVQAAMFLPLMLLSLPAGTIGDLLDRRHFLLYGHAWLGIVLTVLWLTTAQGMMTPGLLIALTIALSIGKAMTLSGFAAVIPSLVPPSQLPLGVGLYSMANNGARILAPAVAGLILVLAGIATVYAASLLALIFGLLLLLFWCYPGTPPRQSGRTFLVEIKAGLSFGLYDLTFRRIIARVMVFFLCAASLHALLPLIVDSASSFGLAWAMYGIGALLGATVFPMLSAHIRPGDQLTFGILAHALLLAGLALADTGTLQMALLLLLGVAWFQVMSSAQVATQRVLPESMRARGMGLFTSVIMAGFGLGAPVWGLVAKWTTPGLSLLSASVLSLAALALTCRLTTGDASKPERAVNTT